MLAIHESSLISCGGLEKAFPWHGRAMSVYRTVLAGVREKA